uniref:Uncharacterized protein n=1 Tax=Anguilla anguilla TaxID=7936 RepID=A0A0E9X9M1_ANGAN
MYEFSGVHLNPILYKSTSHNENIGVAFHPYEFSGVHSKLNLY